MSLFLGIGLGPTAKRGGAISNPESLFASGEEGIWYDPSDLSTLWQDSARTIPVTSDGDPIGAMDDKSGNGNHALQATAGKLPIYKTSGGLHWFEFDAANDFLATGNIDFTATDKMSFFAGLHKANDVLSVPIEFSASSSTNLGSFGVITDTSYKWRSSGTTIVTADATGFGAPTTNILSCFSDIAADEVIVRVDGTQEASDLTGLGTGNFGNYPLYLGQREGVTFPYTGKYYGIIIRGAQSSANEIVQTEAYLAGKSGVTL